MSKAKLKKYLQDLTKEQILQVVLELYDARKAAKDYLEFYMEPDASAALKKAKKELLRNYFTPQGRPRAKMSVKNGNAIVADFIKLQTSPETVADLLAYHVEVLISRLVVRNIIRETAWTSVVNLFRKAADYMMAFGIISPFRIRLDKIIDYSHNSPSYLRVPQRLSQELSETLSAH